MQKEKTYFIKKGKHSSGFHFGITFSKKIAFDCKFDKSCLYGNIGDNDNYDINKLFGFSTTWYHHKQSGRVGWRCLDGENIELLTYSYNDGKRDNRESDVLGVVKADEWFRCTIEDLEDCYKYTFQKSTMKNMSIKYDAKQKDWFLFHYKLFFYFGGSKKCPHDMKITILEL